MPVVSRVTRAAPAWSDVAAAPATAANSGPQPGMFGEGANEILDLVMRGQALGMSPTELSRLGSMSVADATRAVERFEADQYTQGLGEPVYSPVRTRDASTGVLTGQLQQQAAQQAAAVQASRQLTPEQQAIEDRFGNDMAWLDPLFQYEAQTVAPITTQDALRYGTTADPEAQALQRQTVNDLLARSRQGPSAGEQEGLNLQRSAIDRLFGVANQGATPEERASLGRASQVAGDLISRGRAGATGEERQALADQRRMMETLFGDYSRGASDVELEAQAGQRRAMNELFGVWEGGGATALERARRAQARAESENWLLGQRQADMQNLAERGMSGSGAELAALQADRQAAASRLSMADLQTDADLEERAMQALLAGGNQAGALLSGESGIQARRLQQLAEASGAARGISGTLGDIEARSAQELLGGGGLDRDVASGWGNIQNRSLNALDSASRGAASLTGAYGDIEARALQSLLGAEQGASSMRDASDRYVSGNADRLFDAATFNADAINRAKGDNVDFLRTGWRDMIRSRNDWDAQTRDLRAGVARDLFGSDVQENQFGYDAGEHVAEVDTGRRNTGQDNYNVNVLGAHTSSAPVIYRAQGDVAQAGTAGLRAGGDTIQKGGQFAANYFTGGAAGMARQPYSGSGTAVFNPTDEQNPYRNYGRTG